MKFLRIAIIVATVWVLLTRGSKPIDAQEKDPSYPRTHIWSMHPVANVTVIDTAGVCLYIVPQSLGGLYGGGGSINTIAAVAKTQLPKGAGCQ